MENNFQFMFLVDLHSNIVSQFYWSSFDNNKTDHCRFSLFLYHSIDQILFHTPHLKEYLCLNRTTMNPHLWIKMNKKKAVTLNKVTIYGKQTFLVVLNHKPSNINIRRTRIDLFIKPPFCSYVVLILYIIFCRVTYIQLI